MRRTCSIFLMILLTIMLTACGGTNSEQTSADIDDFTADGTGQQSTVENLEKLDDILKSCDISVEDAKEMEQIDDWTGGPRYRFISNGLTVVVYYNMDGTVDGIKITGGKDIYRRGYEPVSINEYVVEEALKPQLKSHAKENIEKYLTYAASADYNLLDWSYLKDHSLYIVGGTASAKNGMGAEKKISFSVQFNHDDSTFNTVYVCIDGKEYVNDLKSVSQFEMTPIEGYESNRSADTAVNTIRLVDGELGEYGKTEKVDSYDYIWYYIPQGTYTITCNTKTCKVYVDKNTKTKNSEGYTEMQNVSTLDMSYGSTDTVIIGVDEHIELTYGGDVTLKAK